jgi:hypothetical protein
LLIGNNERLRLLASKGVIRGLANTATVFKIDLLRQEGEGWEDREDKKQIIGSFSPHRSADAVVELVETHGGSLPHPQYCVSFRAKPTQYWGTKEAHEAL